MVTERLTVAVPPDVILNGTVPPGVPAQVTFPDTELKVKLGVEQAELAHAVTVKDKGVHVIPLPLLVIMIWSGPTVTGCPILKMPYPVRPVAWVLVAVRVPTVGLLQVLPTSSATINVANAAPLDTSLTPHPVPTALQN